MAAIKECSDELITITRISENGSEGENSLFFETNKSFVQYDEEGKEVTKNTFSMSLQGILQRLTADNEQAQDLLDFIGISTLNTPHKYVNVGQAIYASLGKSFDAKMTRKVFNKGEIFEGYEMPEKRFVTTKLVITKSKPSKFAERFINAIKPKEITITI